MARLRCRDRSSLLASLRGSFIPAFRSVNFLSNAFVELIPANERRIYLYLRDNRPGADYNLVIGGTDTSNNFLGVGGFGFDYEFTADFTPGLVQQSILCNTNGGIVQWSIIEIIAGG